MTHPAEFRPAVAAPVLQKFTEAAGVSGDEVEIRRAIRETIEGLVDEIRSDTIGNLFAFQNAPKRGRVRTVKTPEGERPLRVMLDAHMDECGLMVSRIDKDGLIRFGKVGGIDDRVLVSKAVYLGAQRLPGVIGATPIHLQEKSDRHKPIPYDEMYIDIGATSRTEAEKHVRVGDRAIFATRYEEIGRNAAKAKSFDDRAGCAILAESLVSRYGLEVVGAFTVQEEVGLRGAQVAAHAVDPDLAIVLEGTSCNDMPFNPLHGQSTTFGAGPALTLVDSGTIAPRRLVQQAAELAEKHKVPFQYKRVTMGGNDAAAIHKSRLGIPTLAISLPTRYIHAPAQLISLEDYANAQTLLGLILDHLAKGDLTL